MGRAEWTAAEDGTLVGVVDRSGALESIDGLEATIGAHEGTLVTGTVEEVRERSPSLVVCVGDEAMSDVVRTGADVPVLPVETSEGVPSVSTDRLEDALDAVLAGDARTRHPPILRVEGEPIDGWASAFFDVTLVTAEPARISEYSVKSREDRLAQFRADGVVVATPQGSHGYASAAGGPLVSPGLEAVAVVPVAPFVTQTRQWILPDDRLELAVERDEGPVSVQLDERTLGTVTPGSPISITADRSLTVLVPDANE